MRMLRLYASHIIGRFHTLKVSELLRQNQPDEYPTVNGRYQSSPYESRECQIYIRLHVRE